MIIANNILDEKIPKEILPTRLDSAMNLYTNVNINGKSGILVYNTNPDTWNTLYPFYEQNHKFTIDNYKFSKENENYKIKGGIIEGKVMTAEEIITIAKLPSRQELLAKLAGALLGNITKLAVALDQVRSQNENA